MRGKEYKPENMTDEELEAAYKDSFGTSRMDEVCLEMVGRMIQKRRAEGSRFWD